MLFSPRTNSINKQINYVPVTISIKEVRGAQKVFQWSDEATKAVAEHFGLQYAKQRGRPAKVDNTVVLVKSVPATGTKTCAVKGSRGPNGYHLFMSDVKEHAGTYLKQKHDEKLPRGAVLAEIGKTLEGTSGRNTYCMEC